MVPCSALRAPPWIPPPWADRSKEYINRSQKHECRNRDCSRAVPFLGIFISNFQHCVFALLSMQSRNSPEFDPSISDTVESERRQMKQCWIPKNSPWKILQRYMYGPRNYNCIVTFLIICRAWRLKINHPNCHKQYFLLSVIKCISDFLFKLSTQEPSMFKSHNLETWWVAYSIKSMLPMASGTPEPPDPLQPILQLMLTPIFRPKD
jgi:hypothetical protein